MTNLNQRALTGSLFVILIVGCVLWGEWSFLALLGLINILSVWEYTGISIKEKTRLHQLAAVAISGVLFASVACDIYTNTYTYWYCAPLVLIFGLLIAKLFTKEEKPFDGFAHTMVSLVYITAPLLLFYKLSQQSEGKYDYDWHHVYYAALPLLIFISVWLNDTFAYVSGKILGTNKLFERISPGKTWEGFLGGIIITEFLFFILSDYFFKSIEPSTSVQQGEFLHVHYRIDLIKAPQSYLYFLTPVVVSVAGTLGDLAESMLKRSYGIKDSGKILPGHGGMLDRFDALFFVVPFVYAYWKLIQFL